MCVGVCIFSTCRVVNMGRYIYIKIGACIHVYEYVCIYMWFQMYMVMESRNRLNMVKCRVMQWTGIFIEHWETFI